MITKEMALRRRRSASVNAESKYIKDGLVYHLHGLNINNSPFGVWLSEIGDVAQKYPTNIFTKSGNCLEATVSSAPFVTPEVFGISKGEGLTFEVTMIFTSPRVENKDGWSFDTGSAGTGEVNFEGLLFGASIEANTNKENARVAITIEGPTVKSFIKGRYTNISTTTTSDKSDIYYASPLALNRTIYRYTPLKKIYEVRVYDRVLTDEEIMHNYNVDVANYPNLI